MQSVSYIARVVILEALVKIRKLSKNWEMCLYTQKDTVMNNENMQENDFKLLLQTCYVPLWLLSFGLIVYRQIMSNSGRK